MILRMRMQRWGDALALAHAPHSAVPVTGTLSIGFLQVYETLDDLLRDHPGETQYIAIQEQKVEARE